MRTNLGKLDRNDVQGDVWIISDPHFGHKNIIDLAYRPFTSVDIMDETLEKNWNDRIKPGDTVFCLGDFGFMNTKALKRLLARLNGRKILIRGNHDKSHAAMIEAGFWKSMPNLVWKHFYMIHNCKTVGKNLFRKSLKIVLSGHTHHKTKWNYSESGRPCINMSCDAWDFKPVKLEELMDFIREAGPF